MADVYQTIAQQVIELLKQGIVPWMQQGFTNKFYYLSNVPYLNVNLFLLPKEGAYITPSQIKILSGSIKKNATPYMSLFTKPRWKSPDGTTFTAQDFERGFPTRKEIFELDLQRDDIVRMVNVYHIDDVSSLENKQFEKPLITFKTIASAVGKIYRGEPAYDVKTDYATVTGIETPEEIWEALRIAIRKTGHPRRLNRPGIVEVSKNYQFSKEDLVEDIGAAIIMDYMGESFTVQDGYAERWVKILTAHPYMFYSATTAACDAVNYIIRNGKAKEVKNEKKQEKMRIPKKVRKKSGNVHTGFLARRLAFWRFSNADKEDSQPTVECSSILPLPYEAMAVVVAYIITIYVFSMIAEIL